LASGLSHANNNYQDWWWNPAQSGMGLNVGQQNDTIFVAWFNYGDDSKASFLTMGGVLSGNTLTGTLFRGTGPVPGPNYNPALVKQTAVGTASITFNSNTDATLTYSYDNKSGSMALQRFSFAAPNLNQSWLALETNTFTNCSNPNFNGSSSEIRNIKIEKANGTNFTITSASLDGKDVCVAPVAGQYSGSRLSATGTVVCNGAGGGFLKIDDLTIQSDFLNFLYTITGAPWDPSCSQKGAITGVVKKDNLASYDFKTAFKNRILQGTSKTFNVTGVCQGTFSITDSPAAKTIWNGQAAYAVGTTEIVNMPNCHLQWNSQSHITYYDLNFVEIAKTHSDGSYSEYAKSSQPMSVKAGDTGSLGTWTRWDNTSKSSKRKTDVHSYVVEADTTNSVIFTETDRTYDNNNQLELTSQFRVRLNAAGILEWVSATVDLANNQGRMVFQ
jgi:hypothetical protein